MINTRIQEKFASDLIYYNISRLAGTHPDDDISIEKPSKQFLIGSLAARRSDSDDNENFNFRASRLRVSIFIKKSELDHNPEVTICGTGHVYYMRDYPRIEWKRIPFNHECKLSLKSDDCTEHLIDFSKEREIANRDHGEIPNGLWTAKIYFTITNYNDDLVSIDFFLENDSVEPRIVESLFDRTLFNCKLCVNIGNLQAEKFCDEYVYEGYKQAYLYDFRTQNCQARWTGKNRFITEHFGLYLQKNIRPKECLDIPGVDLTFSNLADPNNFIYALDGFFNEMKKCCDIYKKAIPVGVSEDEFRPRNSEENRKTTWKEYKGLTKRFENLTSKVEKGINIIKSNPKAKNAFLRTNETFRNHYQNLEKPIHKAGWRLFQLAFLLFEIESITDKKNLDVVDVLHADTSSGKSEAYIALVIFTNFYEGLNGRKDGVVAIVKFPLRMVSIQQYGRLSSFVIHAEAVRKKYPEFTSPFSTGYFVGNKPDDNDFPDVYKKVKVRLYEKGSYNKKDKSGKLISPAPVSIVIPECPLCPSSSKGTLRLIDDPKGKRIIHRCDKCGNESYIYHSDREIYRWKPTIITSTVDKWVGLAYQRRARNILGGNGSMCPDGDGFIPSGDKCEDNKDEDFECSHIGQDDKCSYDPVLSVQDEIHLLRESFGTIAAPFEGLIDTNVENFSGRRLKHVAMSATLNGIENQIYELYNVEKYFVIPGRCPEGVGSQNDFFFKEVDGPRHIICGLKPNLTNNYFASLKTLLHYAEFITKCQEELNDTPNDFCKKYGIESRYDAQELIKQYIIPLTYHLKKQDAMDMGRLKDPFIGDRLRKNFDESVILDIILTGESNIKQLREAMDKIKDYIKNYNGNTVKGEGLKFLFISVTSVFSHGVDLDELNFMIFQGLPYSTSEYIQALSRVGRKNLGIIFLWFSPYSVRDNSFYINFDRYHNSLDHQVAPIPIKRSSRLGVLQTINSIFCAVINTYMSNKIGHPCYHRAHFDELTSENQEEVKFIIKKVYGRDNIDLDIDEQVKKRFDQIIYSDAEPKEWFVRILARYKNPYFRNQKGMRGIQKELALKLINGHRDKLEHEYEIKEYNENFIHSIPENRSIFHGYPMAIFSSEFGGINLSFRVISNYIDYNKNTELNTEKYRIMLTNTINKRIATMHGEEYGTGSSQIDVENIKIEHIRLIDNDKKGISGYFVIYPLTMLCKKDDCNHYFSFEDGRRCGHKDTDPLEQLTFINFCDVCGWTFDIYENWEECNCGSTDFKLWWPPGMRDIIDKYEVICIKCENKRSLHFEKCRKCGTKKLRSITVRSNSIINPVVMSIPYIPKESDKSLTDALNDCFDYKIKESELNLPEFKYSLLKEENFWEIPKIKDIIHGLKISDISQYTKGQFLKIIKKVLKAAEADLQKGDDRRDVLCKYGIDFIKRSLDSVKDIDSDSDLQCIIDLENRKELPKNFSSNIETNIENFKKFLNDFGLEKIIFCPDIKIIQALLGIVIGSERKDPALFRVIKTGKPEDGDKKPTVLVRDFRTEGILIELDRRKIIDWLMINKIDDTNILPPECIDIDIYYRDLMRKDDNCRKMVIKMLHTLSHMLIQTSTIDTGLDITSISEIVDYSTASIFTYSTSPVNTGGFEYIYDNCLENWFNRAKELTKDCPQDPACMIDEKGACNACSYIPEFVCNNFNRDIDRSTLVGGSDRFKGYLI